MPQHQRSVNAPLPPNPTKPAGNYWELATRLYFDSVRFGDSPEIPYPVKMWIDDIKLTYVEESSPISVDVNGFSTGETTYLYRGAERTFAVSVTNSSGTTVCGNVTVTAGYWLDSTLIDSDTNQLVGAELCVSGGATKLLRLASTPRTELKYGSVYNLGVSYVSADQIKSDSMSTTRSIYDENIEKRWYENTGPHDGVVSGDFVRVFLK